MDQERERIQEDLRGLLSGEIRCDDLFLQLYASDASIYEIKPLGVVRPRTQAVYRAGGRKANHAAKADASPRVPMIPAPREEDARSIP